jgi:hypothetical protein
VIKANQVVDNMTRYGAARLMLLLAPALTMSSSASGTSRLLQATHLRVRYLTNPEIRHWCDRAVSRPDWLYRIEHSARRLVTSSRGHVAYAYPGRFNSVVRKGSRLAIDSTVSRPIFHRKYRKVMLSRVKSTSVKPSLRSVSALPARRARETAWGQ